jgi:hypothetical protein
MGSTQRPLHPLPLVAEYQALLHSAGRDEFDAAMEDFLAAPPPRKERREQNRPVLVDRRRPWAAPVGAYSHR